jgi:DNA-binding response OmpR family regulator
VGTPVVVVIEDEEAIASAVEARLASAGYAVRTAHDGPSGVDLVAAVDPDLVVLDLMLPGLDGLGCAGASSETGGCRCSCSRRATRRPTRSSGSE